MSRYGGRKKQSGPNAAVLIGVVALLGGGLGGGYYYLNNVMKGSATDATTGCLTKREAPEAVLIMVDQTDKLSKENAERIRQHIIDRVEKLPRYSRVTIVPFGGDIATPLHPIFDFCVPGKADDGGLTEGAQILAQKHEEFKKTLDGLVEKLQSIPDAKESPITAQIERAVADEVLHWSGQAKSLYLITDGLESSVYWTKQLQLPKPSPDMLKGVNVEYFEIGNAKASRYQTPALRKAWKEWLETAGAKVRMVAPGYPA